MREYEKKKQLIIKVFLMLCITDGPKSDLEQTKIFSMF